MTTPTGPIANDNGGAPVPVRVDSKDLLTIALGQDVQRTVARQQAVQQLMTQPGMTQEVALEQTSKLGGRIQVVDVREIMLPDSAKRATEGKNGQPGLPNRITLGVPSEVLLSVRPGSKEQKVYVMLAVIPADVAGAIASRKTKRIVTPDEARIVGGPT